ncbi:hypothetical protein [Longimicrobium sp.]|uniref:hypothetical protein n=1 Tax=Longimicrobium sp. TaxID=2029185 RepID=UPI002C6D858F|nr:hypothetical protein [Longimicrobium sp.]HSU15748.1 hypothetical protein [Longimicrobium sp.]
MRRRLELVRMVEPERLRFSFRYLDTTHPAFSLARCGAGYFHLLLKRLHELSSLSAEEFRARRSGTLRVHPIDFSDPRVAVPGFGIRGVRADEIAWQFALSANAHGRVHGFLFEDTFYVRWLDPEHNLYPGN